MVRELYLSLYSSSHSVDMFPMYCDLGKECKKTFKRFVILSVTALRPQDGHSDCQVQFFQYVLGVIHFTELSGGRGGSSRSSSSKIQDILFNI